jgi:phenylalanyl-tRNA synthetase beta chain
MRSINTMVDITNVVMHELGYPMHAFDRDRLDEGRVIVRAARARESLETLDHTERILTTDMTVIADASRPVGLAGIMGGFDAEMTSDTTRLLLEVAHFHPTITRATSRALKLRTDASGRYERGVDPEGIPGALARAAQLIVEFCPGATFAGVTDVYPVQREQKSISFKYDRVERLLGIAIDESEARAILDRLGFLTTLEGGVLTVWPPSWRADVNVRQDVIEEIARVAGYDRLPATLPSGATQRVHRDPMYRMRKAARETLTSLGYSEAVTYLTLEQSDIERFSDGASAGIVVESHAEWLLKVKNALQADRNILRPTLIPSMLGSLAANLKHESSVRLAELARIYSPADGEILPYEAELVGLVTAGAREPFGLGQISDPIDFRDLSGTVETLLHSLGATTWNVRRWQHPAFHPGRAAEILVNETVVARYGELHPSVATAYNIEDQRVLAGEINLSVLLDLIPARGRDAFVPRSLPVRQDFAVIVDAETPAADVESAFRMGAGSLLTDITLFDQFVGPQIGEGKMSLAYRLTFTAPDRTLTDNDLVKIRPKIEKVLKQQVNGVLRV